MLRVMINSGLGNQMFQYAFAMGLATKRDDVICDIGLLTDRKVHNGEHIHNVFKGIQVVDSRWFAFITRTLYYLIYVRNIRIIRKVINFLSWDLIMDEDSLTSSKTKNQILLGYWQSVKFFPSNSFQYYFREERLSAKTRELSSYLKQEKQRTISIHVRRGDYLNLYGLYGGICTVDYYENAICYLCSQVKRPLLFIFSDDLDWVKENLEILNRYDVTYVDFNKGENSWQDMYLMSQCSYNIIANSTFSWWGAWLNANPDKIVVSPTRLTNQVDSPKIFPETWVKLSSEK